MQATITLGEKEILEACKMLLQAAGWCVTTADLKIDKGFDGPLEYVAPSATYEARVEAKAK